jgi:hypothetical protein
MAALGNEEAVFVGKRAARVSDRVKRGQSRLRSAVGARVLSMRCWAADYGLHAGEVAQ